MSDDLLALADAVREHALSLPGAWPDEPWEGDLVAKVGPGERGKIFAFLGATRVGVKCATTRAVADEWLDVAQAFAGPPGDKREPASGVPS